MFSRKHDWFTRSNKVRTQQNHHGQVFGMVCMFSRKHDWFTRSNKVRTQQNHHGQVFGMVCMFSRKHDWCARTVLVRTQLCLSFRTTQTANLFHPHPPLSTKLKRFSMSWSAGMMSSNLMLMRCEGHTHESSRTVFHSFFGGRTPAA
jgi:hypothetical protein